jgi:uncharacterized protein with HEPN domain
MRSETLYLTDIVDAVAAVERFLGGTEREAFFADEIRQSAVLLKLSVIGEAASRVSPETRDQFPNVKWRNAIGLRNIGVHEYFSLNWDIAWTTATEDFPLLREQIETVLKDLAQE